MPKLTISTTGLSEKIPLYEGTNLVTLIIGTAIDADILVNNVPTPLPESVSATENIAGSINFLLNGPATLVLDVQSITGAATVTVEKSHG